MKNRSFKIWGILWWLVTQILQWTICKFNLKLLLYRLFSLIWRLHLMFDIKVTNLENVNCTGPLRHSNQLLSDFFACCNSFVTNAKSKKSI
jgi:hypothetical protein